MVHRESDHTPLRPSALLGVLGVKASA